MPKSFTIERENLPAVVQGWLKAAGIGDLELVEVIFTDGEIVLRRPLSPQLRAWASAVGDSYDKAFRRLAGLEKDHGRERGV